MGVNSRSEQPRPLTQSRSRRVMVPVHLTAPSAAVRDTVAALGI